VKLLNTADNYSGTIHAIDHPSYVRSLPKSKPTLRVAVEKNDQE